MLNAKAWGLTLVSKQYVEQQGLLASEREREREQWQHLGAM
jgi:hypothetical protein